MIGNHVKNDILDITRKRIISSALVVLLLASMFMGLIVVNNFVENAKAITVPGDFPTIQDAINNSIEGGTIYVWAGMYNENIVVNKTLTIIGNGTANTTINGQGTGDVVSIISNWVNITGFNITKGGNGTFDSGVELDNVHNCNITDNLIRANGQYGIRLVNSSDNNLTFNILRENRWDNIHLDNSHDNTVENNTIYGGEDVHESGLVGYWKMDEGKWEGKPFEVKDSSDYRNHGSTNGSANTTYNAKIGRAGYFDGDNDYVRVPSSSSLNITSDITIGLWAKLDGPQDDKDGIVHKFSGPSTNYKGYRLRIGNSDQPVFAYGDDTSVISNIWGPSLSLDQWNHVVVQKEDTSLRMYIDGALVNSATGSANIAGTPIDMYIGYSSYNFQSFNGTIDELMIYDYALSEDEIAELYRFSPSRVGINLNNSSGNFLTSNNVSFHGEEGIRLENSSGNTLAYNVLRENGRDNIYLENSNDNIIEGNVIEGMGDIDRSGLVGSWKMDEAYWDGIDREVIDSSDYANHGTAKKGSDTT
ncbi:MAG: right-handed parallel beta-helix repeat-containing protein, partial [Methanomassiliicoccales archaeon]